MLALNVSDWILAPGTTRSERQVQLGVGSPLPVFWLIFMGINFWRLVVQKLVLAIQRHYLVPSCELVSRRGPCNESKGEAPCYPTD